MRREALDFLACPNCGGELSLRGGDTRAEDGHVMAGELACSVCASRFPIREGVPVLLPGSVEAVKLETASRFAEEWLRWSDLRDYYHQEFLAWLAPLTPGDFAGQAVFEGGCGKGRHTALVASYGAKAVVAIDLGQSALVAFAHTRHLPNAHVVIGDLLRPPVRPVFDLAFSVGVLHHLPDPAAGFRSLASRLRDGGKGPSMLPYGDYFASMYAYPFDEIHANVFDQLVTPVAYYLSGDEVRSWLADGFRDVTVRSHRGYSWTGLATVRRTAAARAS